MKQRPPTPRTAKTNTLSVGTTQNFTIESLDNDGIGWCRQDGVTVTIPGAYPGETVTARITHRGRSMATAALTRILTPSPQRLPVTSCRNTGECDGCPLINLSAEAQHTWKTDRVRYAFHAYQALKEVLISPLATPGAALRYRNSCKLVIGGTFNRPVIGIYKRRSHAIVPLLDCPLHHPLLNRIAKVTAEGIRKLKVPIYHQQTGNGFLRYLAVRVSETANEALVVLVTGQRSFNELHHLAAYLQRSIPEVSVIAQNINPSLGNIIFGQQDVFQTKRHYIVETLQHIRLQLSPRSFFQVNTAGAGYLYQSVATGLALTGREHVLDIYCGVGGIGLYLAKDAASVTGIEEIEPAVADAERNARLNRLTNCRFIAGDASEQIEELLDAGEHFDRIVVNPPRSGCSKEVLDAIIKSSPPLLAYVSCNPDTLARDLLHLVQNGFKIVGVQPVDMFPQTPHVECVAILQQG
jgi:23S rRNA (uracil1939-C5)-methyltransferase